MSSSVLKGLSLTATGASFTAMTVMLTVAAALRGAVVDLEGEAVGAAVVCGWRIRHAGGAAAGRAAGAADAAERTVARVRHDRERQAVAVYVCARECDRLGNILVVLTLWPLAVGVSLTGLTVMLTVAVPD